MCRPLTISYTDSVGFVSIGGAGFPFMIGIRFAHYEITSHLGSGGMGEVYQAIDSSLGRSVAIKFLPEAFTQDSDHIARFQREARVLASLNHPHIAAIHGLEESGGRNFLVMELVEGETLQERLTRGPIHVDEALPIAKQIAEALEAAHEKGIIHRDLKPANIKLTTDGKVKVLDFGLAKAFGDEKGADLSNSPTLSMAATGAGTILGTAAYMSPEQTKGQMLDRRTDMFSFGAVLYEILTAQQAFPGPTVGDILAAVIRAEPDWNRLPSETPPGIRRLLRRCLQKDRNRRLKEAGDARIEIEEARAEPELTSAVGRATASRRRERFAWILSAVLLIGMAVAVTQALRPSSGLRPLRLSIVPPAGTTFTSMDISGMPHFAMSPDGSRLAFVASAPGARPQLWVQQLESGAAQPLPGTDDARGPFWAPDSRSLAFYARGKLKKVPLDGTVPQDLTDVAVDVTSGAWNADGIIVFDATAGDGLFRISAEGGAVTPATKLDAARGEVTHRWPQFLPDGRRFIFYVRSTIQANSGVYVGSIDSGEKTQVLPSIANAVYARSGHLLFEQAGNLMVQAFDATAGVLRGQPSAFGDQVSSVPGPSYLSLSIGADGTMAYWSGQAATTELLWFDRNGRPLGNSGSARPYQSPALSPYARSLLITEQISPARADLWHIDLSSGVPSRLTFPIGAFSFGRFGIWSPDGKEIVYSSIDTDGLHLYQMAPSGGDPKLLSLGPSAPSVFFPDDWSHDGRWLVYNVVAKTAWDIWAFSFVDRKSRPILEEPYSQLQGRLSPDGRWLAYASDESGNWEVYVQPFPEGRSKRLVSSGGGSQPLWRGDGKELFYVAADNRLVAVPIRGTDTFEVGVSQPLFATRIPEVLAPYRTNYAVSSDGQRFLVNSLTPQAAPAAITIAVDWQNRWK
jgi:serine/threonine protein kinase/Tol biopolymer transport system component